MIECQTVTLVIRLRVIEGPKACNEIAFSVLRAFLVEVRTNAVQPRDKDYGLLLSQEIR